MSIKSIFGLAAVSLLLTSCQSNSFHIKGFARQLPEGDTICLVVDSQPQEILATTTLCNCQFMFSGEADSILLCRIYAKSQPDNGVSFFLEPSNIAVELNKFPTISRVSGTRINNEWQHLNDSIQLLGKELIRLSEAGIAHGSSRQENIKRIDSLHRKMSDCILNTARRNSGNTLGLYIQQNYIAPEFK